MPPHLLRLKNNQINTNQSTMTGAGNGGVGLHFWTHGSSFSFLFFSFRFRKQCCRGSVLLLALFSTHDTWSNLVSYYMLSRPSNRLDSSTHIFLSPTISISSLFFVPNLLLQPCLPASTPYHLQQSTYGPAGGY
jgi:hypothetical protein